MYLTSLVCYKMSTMCPEDSSKVVKRKKTRRGKRYRNEEERRRLINEYMKQRKHKVAPSNTTQFLIEDREKVEPILVLSSGTPLSGFSSPEVDQNTDLTEFDCLRVSEEDHFNEQFFLKDFEATYRQMYRENLYGLSKSELLEKVKVLESRRDNLERQYRCCRENHGKITNKQPQNQNLEHEIEELQQQIDLLQEENRVLRQTNAFNPEGKANVS